MFSATAKVVAFKQKAAQQNMKATQRTKLLSSLMKYKFKNKFTFTIMPIFKYNPHVLSFFLIANWLLSGCTPFRQIDSTPTGTTLPAITLSPTLSPTVEAT